MVALEFLDFLTKFQITNYVGIEDFSDRFHFHFTVIILLVSTLIVTVKQYVLKPISCYMANDIGGKNLLGYVENYCWIQGTIPISYKGKIPTTDEELELLENDKILYYQWVPFALGLQCIMFYIPRLIWQIICYNHTGTDIQHLVTSANQAVHANEEARTKMVVYLAKSIVQTCYQHREYRKGPISNLRRRCFGFFSFFIISKRMGTKIIMYYLILKFLYLINGICQLYLMQRFLGFVDKDNKSIFGAEIVSSIFSGKDWQDSLIFPRVGFCFLRIRTLGSMNTAVAQCVLPVNMLNERIYIFLWCWIFIGVLLTVISVFIWIWRIFYNFRSPTYTKKFLILKEVITNDNKNDEMLSSFEKLFLRQDGLFLLKMISINAGDVLTSDVIVNLWQIYTTSHISRQYSENSEFHQESSTSQISKCLTDSFAELKKKVLNISSR